MSAFLYFFSFVLAAGMAVAFLLIRELYQKVSQVSERVEWKLNDFEWKMERQISEMVPQETYELSRLDLHEVKSQFRDLQFHVEKKIDELCRQVSDELEHFETQSGPELERLSQQILQLTESKKIEPLFVSVDQLDESLFRLKQELMQEWEELRKEKDEERWDSLSKALSSPPIGGMK